MDELEANKSEVHLDVYIKIGADELEADKSEAHLDTKIRADELEANKSKAEFKASREDESMLGC